MSSNRLFLASDILSAFALLSRLPLPIDHELAGQRAGLATWAYPIVGAVLGGIAALVGSVALWIGVVPGLSAALALATLALLTGAMHEDGLADCADGLGGGRDKASALKIMKDSRIGAYGAVALMLALLGRWSGIEAIILQGGLFWPLVLVGAFSRLPMVLALGMMDAAKTDGLAAGMGRPPRQALWAAVGICLVIGLGVLGFATVKILLVTVLAALPLALLARRKIGGYSGDILGGMQQCAEIAALAMVSAAL